MNSSVHALLGLVLAAVPFHSSSAKEEPVHAASTIPSEQVRQELLAARETAWRSFFQKDSSVVERILAPELIAIQEGSERWETRASLTKMAKTMDENGIQLTRLEFPRTEIQLFGDTAILYYTYVMQQRLNEKVVVEAGRGTEIFVRRDGRWVDVGWHLDSGAFRRKDGAWVRLGMPVPEPSP